MPWGYCLGLIIDYTTVQTSEQENLYRRLIFKMWLSDLKEEAKIITIYHKLILSTLHL